MYESNYLATQSIHFPSNLPLQILRNETAWVHLGITSSILIMGYFRMTYIKHHDW